MTSGRRCGWLWSLFWGGGSSEESDNRCIWVSSLSTPALIPPPPPLVRHLPISSSPSSLPLLSTKLTSTSSTPHIQSLKIQQRQQRLWKRQNQEDPPPADPPPQAPAPPPPPPPGDTITSTPAPIETSDAPTPSTLEPILPSSQLTRPMGTANAPTPNSPNDNASSPPRPTAAAPVSQGNQELVVEATQGSQPEGTFPAVASNPNMPSTGDPANILSGIPVRPTFISPASFPVMTDGVALTPNSAPRAGNANSTPSNSPVFPPWAIYVMAGCGLVLVVGFAVLAGRSRVISRKKRQQARCESDIVIGRGGGRDEDAMWGGSNRLSSVVLPAPAFLAKSAAVAAPHPPAYTVNMAMMDSPALPQHIPDLSALAMLDKAMGKNGKSSAQWKAALVDAKLLLGVKDMQGPLSPRSVVPEDDVEDSDTLKGLSPVERGMSLDLASPTTMISHDAVDAQVFDGPAFGNSENDQTVLEGSQDSFSYPGAYRNMDDNASVESIPELVQTPMSRPIDLDDSSDPFVDFFSTSSTSTTSDAVHTEWLSGGHGSSSPDVSCSCDSCLQLMWGSARQSSAAKPARVAYIRGERKANAGPVLSKPVESVGHFDDFFANRETLEPLPSHETSKLQVDEPDLKDFAPPHSSIASSSSVPISTCKDNSVRRREPKFRTRTTFTPAPQPRPTPQSFQPYTPSPLRRSTIRSIISIQSIDTTSSRESHISTSTIASAPPETSTTNSAATPASSQRSFIDLSSPTTSQQNVPHAVPESLTAAFASFLASFTPPVPSVWDDAAGEGEWEEQREEVVESGDVASLESSLSDDTL